MGSLLLRIVATLLGVLCLVSALGGLMTLAAPRPPLRGEMVDIGGRRLRLVCEGPRSARPLVVLESGIFGFASDWGEVQRGLAARGLRSCAYDRAGLAWSDPGPAPRDGLAVVRDLEALLRAKGEAGPLVLVGHSMAGLHTRLFALRNPTRVRGLLLVDAASPSAASVPDQRRFLTAFDGMARASEIVGSVGLLEPFAPVAADMIGLDGPAHAEKVWFWAYPPSIRAGAAETYQALAAAEQAAAAGRLSPDLPVGAVTEGRLGRHGAWADARLEGALASRHGFSVNIPDATHASMLGRAHAEVIADAVVRVMGEATNKPKKPPPASGGG